MSMADTEEYQNIIKKLAMKFAEDMVELYREVPEDFEGRSTLEQWANQVWQAKLDLDERIAEQIEEVEMLLHDGQYHREL